MLILSLSLSEKLANALLVIRLRSDIFMRLASQSSFAPASFSAMHSPSLYVLTAACLEGIMYNALVSDEKCQVLDLCREAGIDFTAPIHCRGSVYCLRRPASASPPSRSEY